MIKRVPIKDLKVGMYVILDLSWHEHPFLKSNFLISSAEDLKKIESLGIPEVKVDTSRSVGIEESPSPKELPEIPAEIIGTTIDTNTLFEHIRDQSLEPEKKAELIRTHATKIMQKLFDLPSMENIKQIKKVAKEITHLILRDDKTTFFLVSITQFDFTTYNHSLNVGFLAIALAKSVFSGPLSHNLPELGAGFFLHDIGKVKIDSAILNKPGPLTSEEMLIMKKHPFLGFKLLHEAGFMSTELKLIVLQHHEKLDGSGYPKGLKGSDVHPYAQICTIADVFDALTSRRPYRDPLSTFEALKLIKKEMVPHQIDKNLYEQFVLIFKPPQ